MYIFCFPNTTIQLIFGTSLGIIFLLFIIIILTQCICKFMTCLCRTQSSDNKPLKKVRFKSKDSLNADPNNYESPSVSLRSSNNSLPYDDVPSLSVCLLPEASFFFLRAIVFFQVHQITNLFKLG